MEVLGLKRELRTRDFEISSPKGNFHSNLDSEWGSEILFNQRNCISNNTISLYLTVYSIVEQIGRPFCLVIWGSGTKLHTQNFEVRHSSGISYTIFLNEILKLF
jgi:hypothetical protein